MIASHGNQAGPVPFSLIVALCAISCCLIACNSAAPSHSPEAKAQDVATQDVKAQQLDVFSDGLKDMVGDIGVLADLGNNNYSAPSSGSDTVTVWIFRDFNKLSPEFLSALGEHGIQPGKAYLVTANGLKFIKDIDLKLTDEQLATLFGILPDNAMDAFRNGNLEEVKSLLKENPNLVFSKLNGDTPLHLAVQYGQKDVAELLLVNKADVDAKDNESYTPLLLAINDNNDDVELPLVELLLSNNADVNLKNNEGCTPLLLAVKHDNKFLADNNDSKDSVELRSKDLVELLLAHNADVNAKDNDGDTPLLLAVNNDSKDLVELLLAHKADVNAKDNKGETPLHSVAGYTGDKDMVELLLANHADINAKDNKGDTPLHYAAGRALKDLVEVLLANGADVNVKDNAGDTPLRYSSQQYVSNPDDMAAVAELLRQHAGVDQTAPTITTTTAPPNQSISDSTNAPVPIPVDAASPSPTQTPPATANAKADTGNNIK